MPETENLVPSKTSPKLERDEKGRLLPGQAALNPNGRPKGRTIREQVRQWLEDHPMDNEDFIKHFIKKNRELAWQMMEGSPKGQTDITSGGKELEGLTKKTDDELRAIIERSLPPASSA